MEESFENDVASATPPRVSGKVVVAAMFGFALFIILALYAYWDLYTRPFRPLQYALAQAYPGSSPRVIGGQHKSHKPGGKKTLRIVMRVPEGDFDPESDTQQREARSVDVVSIAAEHVDIAQYEVLELHLFRPVPEKQPLRWSVSRPVEEWEQLLADAANAISNPEDLVPIPESSKEAP